MPVGPRNPPDLSMSPKLEDQAQIMELAKELANFCANNQIRKARTALPADNGEWVVKVEFKLKLNISSN